MIPELIGAAGLVLAAIITGTFRVMRRENTEAHGRAIKTLDRIAATVEDIADQLDDLAEWQVDHDRYHSKIDVQEPAAGGHV